MLLSVFDSKEFKRLKAEWYARLREADPEWRDIESPGGHLRGPDPRTQERAFQDRPQREAYVDWASYVLHTLQFGSGLERCIWELHTQGYSVRQIGAIVKCPFQTVQLKIKQVRLRAKL